MAVSVMSLVWQVDGLTCGEKLVLVRLADFASAEGGRIFPAVERVAADCGLHRRNVQRILRRLEAARWIQAQRRSLGRHPSSYTINLKRLNEFCRNRGVPSLSNPQQRRSAAVTAAYDTFNRGVAPPDPSRDPSIIHQDPACMKIRREKDREDDRYQPDLTALSPDALAALQRQAEDDLRDYKWRLTEPQFARALRMTMQRRIKALA